MTMLNAERIDKLLNDLMDHEVEGGAVSSFGDTGYDPSVDFPVCRRAVEELVSMGGAIVPRMLETLSSNDDVQSYFAAEVLGRLQAVEATGPLEKRVRSMDSFSRRVNYDQYIEYPVYKQALDALLRIDKALALSVLLSLVETNPRNAHWAKAKLIELT